MLRKVEFAPGEFYHIYNRGTEKRDIFIDEKDKKRFSSLLYLCNGTKPVNFREIPKGRSFEEDRGETVVDIGAYCLMSNHFHLLIYEKLEGGITTFMKKLCTAHSMYFNRKYGRTGTLFEGRFKSLHIDSDKYLNYLLSYIHLNLIDHVEPNWKENGIRNIKNAEEYLRRYAYSSYPDYLGVERPENIILEKSSFPNYFSKKKDFKNFINEWIRLKSRDFVLLGQNTKDRPL